MALQRGCPHRPGAALRRTNCQLRLRRSGEPSRQVSVSSGFRRNAKRPQRACEGIPAPLQLTSRRLSFPHTVKYSSSGSLSLRSDPAQSCLCMNFTPDGGAQLPGGRVWAGRPSKLPQSAGCHTRPPGPSLCSTIRIAAQSLI